ncbi:DNA-deoxyinosine glycosylase [uncultured Bacteroides sp.]|uniref:DNA-deoxyinosine glycosylase n=1 Tax=uncultured Bacteroides sp. TaxID=162156 RepID=UPI002610FCEC|nr:DNA-deoxyinosine glycosylase [uncultured Bacteroides sp.]
MNIDDLQKAIENDYQERNIKKRRYSALNKVIIFLKKTFQYTDDINFIVQIKKEELKQIYKATNSAENQAINDIYNYLNNPKVPKISLKESQIKNSHLEQTNKHFKEGLLPWIGKNPKVLILGTMPSDASIEKQSYYTNPSNSFWKIMYSLFPKRKGKDHKEYITSHGIALWDCIKSGIRVGSMDKGFNSKSKVPNDLISFLNKYPSIKIIILNGKTTTTTDFYKYFPNLQGYTIKSLYSTASYISLDKKIQEWSIIKDLVK